ncbi:hypothetical protein lerEdw1_008092 [Lerista edwardsae]|nr:hypothetical protein lerEdw1_008092 [Lerista edwardsae]
MPNRDTWLAAKGTSIFQSKHMNIWLREQINCLLSEGNNIKASIWDLQRSMRNMKGELKRIKHAEEKITFLEAEIQEAKKTQEEQNTAAALEDQYLKKLENDNENLHLRIFMLSEKGSSLMASRKVNQQSYLQLCCHVNKLRRELQECKLTCGEEDEAFTKMKHQIRELEEYLQEYQVKIKVLQDREKTLQDELSTLEKARAQDGNGGSKKMLCNYSLLGMPRDLCSLTSKILADEPDPMEERIQRGDKTINKQLCGGRMKIVWILLFLWHFADILLVILLSVLLAILFILGVCLSNHTVTEAYQRPMWQFLDYYIQPYMQLYSTGILPN